jgi:hypothetical protein
MGSYRRVFARDPSQALIDIYTHIYTLFEYIYIYIYIYIYNYIYIYVCVFVDVRVMQNASALSLLAVFVVSLSSVCVSVCLCVRVCLHACLCACVRVCLWSVFLLYPCSRGPLAPRQARRMATI